MKYNWTSHTHEEFKTLSSARQQPSIFIVWEPIGQKGFLLVAVVRESVGGDVTVKTPLEVLYVVLHFLQQPTP